MNLIAVFPVCTLATCSTTSLILCRGSEWMREDSWSRIVTFFPHADAETLLQATVLALVPVVLVNLTLSV